jgi:hypothetical protein
MNGDPFRRLVRLKGMGSREMVTAARIRQELRERLMAEQTDGVWETLRAFDDLASAHPELRPEAERWRLRFELLVEGGEGGEPLSPVA